MKPKYPTTMRTPEEALTSEISNTAKGLLIILKLTDTKYLLNAQERAELAEFLDSMDISSEGRARAKYRIKQSLDFENMSAPPC